MTKPTIKRSTTAAQPQKRPNQTIVLRDPYKWWNESNIAGLALFVSVISLLFSIYTFFRPGILRPIPPSGYALIRGIGPSPSDHLVLPFDWENTSGKTTLVRRVALTLVKIDTNGKETTDKLQYYLAGEYKDISYETFLNYYVPKNSFSVEPDTIASRALVFHIDNWWDDKSANFTHRFTRGEKYNAYLSYQQDNHPQKTMSPFLIEIYSEADSMTTARDNGRVIASNS